MEENKDIFDNFLQSSLGGLEGNVSPGDWDVIAKRLDEIDSKRPIFWWNTNWFKAAGVLLLVAFLGFLGLRSFINTKTEFPVTVSDTTDKAIRELDDETLSSNKELKQASEDLASEFDSKVGQNNGTSETTEINSNQSDIQLKDSKYRSSDQNQKADNSANPNLSIYVLSRNLRKIGDFSTNTPYTAILNASEKDAELFHNFYIPTISKGRQESLRNPNRKGEWELGLSASPALASKLVSQNGAFGGLLNRHYNDITKEGERTGLSYQIGLKANLYITRNVYIGFGIQYDQIGESINYNYVVKDFPNVNLRTNEIESYTEFNRPDEWEYIEHNGNNTYHFVELPLRLGIVVPLLKDRMCLKSEFGVQYMLLAGTDGKKIDATYLNLIDLSASQGYKRHNFGVNLSTGLFYTASHKFEIGATPYFQMALTSIRDKESPIKDKPFNYGLNLQINYLLNNRHK